MNQSRKYFPGFDWVKLVGSTLVMMAHAFLEKFAANLFGVSVLLFFNSVVLNMFIISGFLLHKGLFKKENPKKYLWNYSLKYLAIAYVVSLPLYLFRFARDIGTGLPAFVQFGHDFLTIPLRGYNIFTQLWFLLPLAIGAIISGYAYLNKRQVTLFKVLLILIPFTVGFVAWNKLNPAVNSLYNKIYYPTINVVSMYSGVFFVFLGMRISEMQNRFLSWKWWKVLPFFLVLGLAEGYVEYGMPRALHTNNVINLTTMFIATVIFWGVMQIRTEVLQPYHGLVTLYSGLTYFLHHAEFMVFQHLGIRSGVVHTILCIVLNLAAAIVIDKLLRMRKEKKVKKIEAK